MACCRTATILIPTIRRASRSTCRRRCKPNWFIERTRMTKRITVAVVALCLAVPASARVQLKQSNPKHGETVMVFRENEVEMQFSEPITDPKIVVLDYKGRNIASGNPEIDSDGDLVTQPIKSADPPAPFQGGDYKVEWEVKSKATGELARDSFNFHVHQHP